MDPVQRMWEALRWVTAEDSDALPKPEDPFAAKPQLSSDTRSPSAAPGQADEVWKFSLVPKLKLLKKHRNQYSGKDKLKPELIWINYKQQIHTQDT